MSNFIFLFPLPLSETGLIPIKACLPTVFPKQRSARQKVYDPFEAISIRYKEKLHGPAYYSVPGAWVDCSQQRVVNKAAT